MMKCDYSTAFKMVIFPRVIGMDIVRAFELDGAAHKVKVSGTVENPIFSANDIGAVLGVQNIRQLTANLDDEMKVVSQRYTLGGRQQATFVTEEGLYEILSNSRAAIAKRFRKWVYNIVKEIRLKGTYELQTHLEQEHESRLHLSLLESQQSHLQVTHRTLMDAYAKQHVVYVAKLLDVAPDEVFVKVGATKDVRAREANLRFEVGNFVYVGVIPCIDSYGLEAYVHNRPQFASRRYNQALPNGKTSKEVAKLDGEWSIGDVIALVKDNVAAFEKQTDRLRNEEWQRQDKIADTITSVLNHPDLSPEAKNAAMLCLPKSGMSASPPLQKRPVDIPAPHCPDVHRHPQQQSIQQYDEDLRFVRSFDSITDAAAHVRGTRQNIIDASRLDMLYEGSRWRYVERSAKDIPQALAATLGDMTPKQTTWRVAKLTVDETRVLQVYADKTKAARSINESKGDVIDRAIKNNTERGGYRWAMWDDLSRVVQDTYDRPLTVSTPNRGCRVLCLHPQTGEQIGDPYNTVQEVYLKHKISPASLKKYSDNGLIYKGYRWRILARKQPPVDSDTPQRSP